MEKIMIEYYKIWNKIYKLETIVGHLKSLNDMDDFENGALIYAKRQLSIARKKRTEMELRYELIK